jgi:secondary thiamine-phosphate synthase enzyme
MVVRLSVSSKSREQFIDVTGQVAEAVRASGIQSGTVTLFVPHTTAAITINENADPSVVGDILKGLAEIVPHRTPYYRHREGNSDAHIKSSLVGPSMQLLVENGEPLLGTWQGIYFCEFDGPRARKLWLKIVADPA